MLSKEIITKKAEELFPYQYEIGGDTNIQTDNKRQFFIHSAIWASEQYSKVIEDSIALLNLAESYHSQLFGSDALRTLYNDSEHALSRLRTSLDNLKIVG